MVKILSATRTSNAPNSNERPVSAAKRRLFSSHDEQELDANEADLLAKRRSEENIAYARRELLQFQEDSSRVWDFDFKAGVPLPQPKRFLWFEPSLSGPPDELNTTSASSITG